MSARTARTLAVALALAGAAIAAYLTFAHMRGVAPVCTTGGCEIVQQSRYSEVVGVPVAALGVGFYAAFLLLLLADARTLGAALAAAAALFAVYLLVIQLVVLDALCVWCVANDVLVVALAALAASLLSGRGLARPG